MSLFYYISNLKDLITCYCNASISAMKYSRDCYIVVKGTDMSVFLTEEYNVTVKSNALIDITECLTL
jgi:hypothetical protein